MADRVPRHEYPWWVKISLWGLPHRTAVYAFVWLSLIIAVMSVIYALVKPDSRFYAGVLMVVAAMMYWLSIRWVDEHGSWESHKSR